MYLTDRFRDALSYAFELHRKQVRKGTPIPYFTHLMAVATTVIEYGGSEDEAIAALLHDAVEDQGGLITHEKIRSRFGNEVADIVFACSDSFTIIKPPWKARKEKHLGKLENASPSVFIVSIADKLHNISSIIRDHQMIGDEVWERFKGGKEGQLWYHNELLKIFMRRGSHPLTTKYQCAVKELFSIAGQQQNSQSADC